MFFISAFAAWFPVVMAIGQQSQAVDTFIIANNRKAVHYQGGRLVFYDGIDNNAKPIADVNCFEQRVISSKQGKYFATCLTFINRTGPARIYNNKGEKIGEFDLEPHWKVRDISDNGELIVLDNSYKRYFFRFCDFKGNILVEYDRCRFEITSNGIPVVLHAESISESDLFFVSIFDNKGKIIDEYNSLDYIRETHSSEQAEIILIIHQVKDDRITIWNRLNDSVKTIEILNGSDNIHGPAISRNGQYAVLQVFREEISLIDTINCSEILHKTLNEPFPDGFKIEVILQIAVSNTGKILVMGYSAEGTVGYCILDKSGKMIKSKVLEDFGNDGRTGGYFRIRELPEDKFAIVHKTNKIEIINLK